MESLNACVAEYSRQLSKGTIQKAYRGVMAFMSGLRQSMEARFPENASSALYAGCMDMTYFASTPPELKSRNLKIAVVYLHADNAFETWLVGGNRKVQAEYLAIMGRMDTGSYRLSRAGPGIDSILEYPLAQRPDFDRAVELARDIESKTAEFARGVTRMLAGTK
jgi:hypothetical protein